MREVIWPTGTKLSFGGRSAGVILEGMTKLAEPIFSRQTRAERIADGALHMLGIGLALTGAVLLVMLALGRGSPGLTVATSVYAGALVATFVASACYHLMPWEAARPVLRRLDHAAIYFKIAGTYTPLATMIGGAFAWSVLSIVWALAAVGATAKVFFWQTPGRFGTALYLGLGWLSLALLWPMARTLPAGGTALVVLGGLLYSLGTVFFVRDSLRFQNAIWHAFVLAASGCFFGAIAWSVAVTA